MPDFFTHWAHPRPIVYADHHHISMRFRHGELQSLMSVQQPNRLELPYTITMMGILLLIPKPRHILMVGLGGGSLAKFCYQHLSEARITVVEINPHVIAMRRHFQLPDDDARLEVVCADGAEFVRDTRETFDAILVDGFDADGQSAQLSSKAFLRRRVPHIANTGRHRHQRGQRPPRPPRLFAKGAHQLPGQHGGRGRPRACEPRGVRDQGDGHIGKDHGPGAGLGRVQPGGSVGTNSRVSAHRSTGR